ncbi:MAG: arsenite efflux transporter metallochaperone ArsD [bacterium]|nr:arsenite efflux transporter metallochaperone ArsD [bacterium]
MTKIQVFDPPMCCSTGACGPKLDRKLVIFASDLHWLHQQGVEVERFNLAADPAEFVEHETVNKTLQEEGNGCLPLILVNDLIVSKGIYPSRSDLMKHTGIESEKAGKKASMAAASSARQKNNASNCGPGCDCKTPLGNSRIRMLLGMVITLLIVGILGYKAYAGKLTYAPATADPNSSGYAVATIPENSPPENEVPVQTPTPTKIGENINSINDLNSVAMDKAAVFIYLPGQDDSPIASSTIDAVQAAQSSLQSQGITLGLYSLVTSSPEYTSLSAQIELPAILVLCKGKSSSMVTGDVTEIKLLQAYAAANRAAGGGCCPSSGGSSSAPSNCG